MKSFNIMKKRFLPFWLIVVLIVSPAIKLNCQVSVSQTNPHYFYYKGKTIVLVTSDHHYGAVIDQDFDFTSYLNYLSENGMNLTRIYPGGMFEPPDKYIPGNPLGPRQGRQILPWEKSDQQGANNLLAEKGKPAYKYDLEKWNTGYFKRLKSFVEFAGKKNIIVEVAFFNGMYADCWPLMPMYHGNNIQNIGRYELKDCGIYTTTDEKNKDIIKYQKAYIKKITAELNEFDNLIYDLCDEPSLQGLENGSITVRPDSVITPWINGMKEAFLEAEQKLPKKHLLGQTVQNLSPDLSDKHWCQWLPTEYISPAEKALELDYIRNKPIVDVETNYFGTSLTKNAYTADAVRIEGWWFMLSGGAGMINLNGKFYRGNESGDSITRSRIVPQKKILFEFMKSLDLDGMKQFSDFSISPEGVSSCGIYSPRKQYAIYLYHASPDKEWGCSFVANPGTYSETLIVNSVPSGSYVAEWIDPVSGNVKRSEKLNSNGGKITLATPEYSLDIVLRITRK
jgi:hypothetical protein